MRTVGVVGMLSFCIMVCPALCPRAMGRQKERSLEQDVRELYSNSETTRADATGKLIEAGPQAIPLLLPVLCDNSKSNSDAARQAAVRVLGELKAEAAVPCLVHLLGSGLTLSVFKPEEMVPEEEIAKHDPAFVALVQIGKPAVPVIARYLPFLGPDQANLGLRVLRVINTRDAKAAVETYIKLLEDQTRLAKDVLDDFQYGPGPTR